MGYRYLRAIHNKIQIRLLKALRKILSDSDCLSLGPWSEVMVESGLFQSISDSDDETSLYFLNKDNELLSITFPAILDLNGKYSRISSYFSFSDQEHNINPSTLQEIKAIFQLFPLTNSYMNGIPTEIVEWSSQTTNVINGIYAKTEAKIRKSPRSSSLGTSTSFLHIGNSSREMVFNVNSKCLFKHCYSIGDDSLGLEADIVRPITANLDPDDLFTTNGTSDDHVLIVPNVRDSDGFLIMPDEYRERLQHNSIVLLNVYFKMDVKENFNRDYQIILNSMDMLSDVDLDSDEDM